MAPRLSHIHALSVLLKRVEVDALLTANNGANWTLQGVHAKAPGQEEEFVRECVHLFPLHSREEALNIHRKIIQFVQLPQEQHGIFSLLLSVAKSFLRLDGSNILVRHESMVQWREEIHAIGQSPFLCAFLAWNDRFPGSEGRRCDFSPFAKSDNLRLRQILAQGVAENHFHLKGSAPAFLTTWICLMNHMENRKNHFHDFYGRTKRVYDPAANTRSQDGEENIHGLVLKAAAIRLFLFRLLKHDERSNGLEEARHQELRQYLKTPRVFVSRCQGEANALRATLNPCSLDYIADTSQSDGPYGLLAGEHTFLYRIFRKIYQDNTIFLKYLDLFYAYLLIFIRVREELTQVNDTVGFDNFASFQDRKELFLEGYPAYKDALIEMAYGSALRYGPLKSLEARIVPQKTHAYLHREHIRLERLAAKSDTRLCHRRASALHSRRNIDFSVRPAPYRHEDQYCFHFNPKRRQCGRLKGPCDQVLAKVFHVLHFVKKPDTKIDWKSPSHRAKAIGHCRHFKLRKEMESTAGAILAWRNSGVQQANRVFGIDACNNEIFCRPEVFAPAFRKLKAHHPPPCHEKIHGKGLPPLRITFHAGEDFLDIVDGLRALDEATRFLELHHGDRLGHALALGVDAPQWYASKGNTVFLPKQELLDNTAWLYCRLRHHGLGTEELGHRLRARYEVLFTSIYAHATLDNSRISIETYYEGWKLRGDHPKHYYRNNPKTIPTTLPSQFIHELQDDEQLRSLRKCNPHVVNLVHRYHYSATVKKGGEKIEEFKIFPSYIEAVTKLQAFMREEISHRGIGIETNPSSNYLIGTFRNYEEHPIIRFFDKGLREPEEAEQLLVSINTDDQGVFDTDLENEYVLMACALETAKDSHGKARFKPANIYQWIDNVRRMGLEQSFKNLSDSLEGETDV